MKIVRALPVPLQIGLLACLSIFVFISCRSSETSGTQTEPSWLASGEAQEVTGDPAPVKGELMTAEQAAQLPELGAGFIAETRQGPYTISVTEGDLLVVEASRKGKRLLTLDGTDGVVYLLKGQKTCKREASNALAEWTCSKTGRAEQEARHNDLFGNAPVSLLLTRAGAPDAQVEVVRTDDEVIVRFDQGKALTVSDVDGSLVVNTGDQTVEFARQAAPMPKVP